MNMTIEQLSRRSPNLIAAHIVDGWVSKEEVYSHLRGGKKGAVTKMIKFWQEQRAAEKAERDRINAMTEEEAQAGAVALIEACW